METIIVYADDAEYAQPLLQSMAQRPGAAQTHWIVIACAPRVTHRVSKFASNRSRENWRSKWADKLFEGCVPTLERSGGLITPILARTPLPELVEQLHTEHGAHLQVIDLRRPKTEAAVAAAPQAVGTLRKWLGTVSSVGALSVLLMQEALAL